MLRSPTIAMTAKQDRARRSTTRIAPSPTTSEPRSSTARSMSRLGRHPGTRTLAPFWAANSTAHFSGAAAALAAGRSSTSPSCTWRARVAPRRARPGPDPHVRPATERHDVARVRLSSRSRAARPPDLPAARAARRLARRHGHRRAGPDRARHPRLDPGLVLGLPRARPRPRGARGYLRLRAHAAPVVDRVVAALERDLADGTWERRHGHLRTLDDYGAGMRLVVGHPEESSQ